IVIIVPFQQLHTDQYTQAINLRGYQLLSSDEFINGNTDKLINHLTGYTHFSSEQGIRIRSTDAENALFMMDDVPVYDPYHFYNIFTPFNGHYFSSVQLYKNNMPVEYGGRIDGMIKIESENKNDKSSLILDSDLLLSSLAADFILSDNINLRVGGRISHTSILNNALEDSSTFNFSDRGQFPRENEWSSTQRPTFNFYDINLGLDITLGSSQQLSFSAYKSSDYLQNEFITSFQFEDYHRDPIDLQQTIVSRDDWDNEGVAAKFISNLSSKTVLNASGYYSSFQKNITYLSSLTVDRPGFKMTSANSGLQNSLLTSAGAKVKLMHELSTISSIEGGIEYQHHDVELLAKENNSPYLLEVQNEEELTLFGEYSLNTSAGFGGSAGGRLTRLHSSGQVYAQPNIRLHYNLTDEFRLKSSYSQNIQAVRELTLENRFGREVDFLAMSSEENGYPVLKSDKYMLGLTAEKYQFAFDAEIYYKKTVGLMNVRASRPDPSFGQQNPPAPFYMLFIGEGWTAGLDLLGTYKSKHTEVSVSYTLSKISQQFDLLFNGESFSPKEDRRHQIKVSSQYKFGHFIISGLLNYKTKAPYVSFVRLDDHGDIGQANFNSVVEYLDPYFSLDLALDYGFKVFNQSAQAGVSLLNATNHTNINDLEHLGRVSRNGPGGGDNLFVTKETELLGRTVNVHITLKF
ncbi:MAG: hypothetical protein M3R25_02610, partial [Bacteroidota bacterium]|nr:hypothetical protein [Bacteroidota bacterium]